MADSGRLIIPVRSRRALLLDRDRLSWDVAGACHAIGGVSTRRRLAQDRCRCRWMPSVGADRQRRLRLLRAMGLVVSRASALELRKVAEQRLLRATGLVVSR